MVFHDQKTDIENELRSFETELKYLGLEKDRKLLTKAEVKFFGSEAALNKDYLKHITKKEI